MNEMVVLTVVWGGLLGAVFFGGLWWTVQRIVLSKRPAGLFAASLLIRVSLVLAGFYVIADGLWQRMLACLLGFLCARFIVSRITNRSADQAKSEVHHAP